MFDIKYLRSWMIGDVRPMRRTSCPGAPVREMAAALRFCHVTGRQACAVAGRRPPTGVPEYYLWEKWRPGRTDGNPSVLPSIWAAGAFLAVRAASLILTYCEFHSILTRPFQGKRARELEIVRVAAFLPKRTHQSENARYINDIVGFLACAPSPAGKRVADFGQHEPNRRN
jgi:hypothetical protein